ncbi:MAG: hypothetical protein P4L76_04290 [Beijerinckiaceae bacterium]|nr:hypothetical protein [Beijerinckiaceae bacterium]
MSARENALSALLTLITEAYPWQTSPSRRLRLWSDVAPIERPACFLFEGGFETYEQGAASQPKRILEIKLFVYVDARDPAAVGAASINNIMDALDLAFVPSGSDLPLGRVTLGGTAYRCTIMGRPLKDPGDLDGDGLLIVPIQIILP